MDLTQRDRICIYKIDLRSLVGATKMTVEGENVCRYVRAIIYRLSVHTTVVQVGGQNAERGTSVCLSVFRLSRLGSDVRTSVRTQVTTV